MAKGRSVGKWCKVVLAAVLLALTGYFYLKECGRAAAGFGGYSLRLDPALLAAALLLCSFSYLVEVLIWKLVLARRPGGATLSLRELVAILFASGLFRYLPGRVWTFASQLLWLRKYGVSAATVLSVNLVCTVELGIVSLYLALIYLARYTGLVAPPLLLAAFVLLVGANLLYNVYHRAITGRLTALAAVVTGTDLEPVAISAPRMFLIQGVFSCSWLLTGGSVYLLARGLNLPVGSGDLLPILCALSLSWLAGYLAVVVPGGLGVREELMLLLLKPVLVLQAALVLPLAARVLTLLSEGLLGLVALWCGFRGKVFVPGAGGARD